MIPENKTAFEGSIHKFYIVLHLSVHTRRAAVAGLCIF